MVLGLQLYHENERHIFGDRCEDVLTLVKNLRDGSTFQMIFDFDNYHQSGDDVWQNWLKLRDVTDAFHLKDSDADHQHVPIGQGNGQVQRILADAHERGWSGLISLEPHLVHSQAVAITGASGAANKEFASLGRDGCFQLAAQVALQLLADLDSHDQ